MQHLKKKGSKTGKKSLFSAEDKKRLGLDRHITRRDFVNGMLVASGGLMVSGCTGLGTVSNAPVKTPPLSHSFDKFIFKGDGENSGTTITDGHRVRDSYNFKEALDTGETYDLVVVGGGLGGLTAAYFYNRVTNALVFR